jgi:hypothetical protein
MRRWRSDCGRERPSRRFRSAPCQAGRRRPGWYSIGRGRTLEAMMRRPCGCSVGKCGRLSSASVFRNKADGDGGIGRRGEGKGHVCSGSKRRRQPSGPPRRRKPGSARKVLKVPNRQHGPFADAGIGVPGWRKARPSPLPRQESTLRDTRASVTIPIRSASRTSDRKVAAMSAVSASSTRVSIAARVVEIRSSARSTSASARFHRFAGTATPACRG